MTTTTPEIVIAKTSFASREGDFKRGARVRASHAVVVAHPDLFVPDGTLTQELGSDLDSVVAENERREVEEREAAAAAFAAEAAQRRIKLPEPAIVTAKRDFAAWYLGVPTLILKGSKTLATDPLVIDYPDQWR